MSITIVRTTPLYFFLIMVESWTPLVRTVTVVKLAGDLWTDGGTDGRSEGWRRPKASGQTDIPSELFYAVQHRSVMVGLNTHTGYI